MKRSSDKNAFGSVSKFRPLLLTAIICAVMYILTQLVLTPIYTVILSNRVYQTTFLPYVLRLVLSLAEVLTFGLCYSVVIYTAVMRRYRTSAAVCGIYVAASVIRRAAALGVSFMMYGFVDMRDIFNVSLPVAIEAIQIFIVFLATYLSCKSYRQALAVYVARRGSAGELDRPCFERKSPLFIGALTSAVMLATVNVSMRIYSDIGYGAPSGLSEVLVMIAYYLFDVLLGVLLYAVCRTFISILLKRYGDRISQ